MTKRKIEWTPAADTRPLDAFIFRSTREAATLFPEKSRPDGVVVVSAQETVRPPAQVRGRMLRHIYDFAGSPTIAGALRGRQLSTGRVVRMEEWPWLRTHPEPERVEDILTLLDGVLCMSPEAIDTPEFQKALLGGRGGR